MNLPHDGLLHTLVQYNVIPSRVLHTLPQIFTLLPIATIEDQNLIVQLASIMTSSQHQRLIVLLGRTKQIAVSDAVGALHANDDIQQEFLVIPSVQVFPKLDRLSQSTFPAICSLGRGSVDFPFQVCSQGVIIFDRDSDSLTGGGEAQVIHAIGGADCQVEVRVGLAKRFGNDQVGVGLRGVEDMDERAVDAIALLRGRGRAQRELGVIMHLFGLYGGIRRAFQ